MLEELSVWHPELRLCVLQLVPTELERGLNEFSKLLSTKAALFSADIPFQEFHGKTASDGQPMEVSRHDIYAFDQYTSGKLEVLPDNASTKSIQAHLLARDPHSKERRMRNAVRDWTGILISTSKLVEIVILWKHDAVSLSLINGLCWLYYFLAAAVLQLCGLSREYSEAAKCCEVDIIAGQLPTPMKIGGPHKILLGAPENVRNDMFWRLTWAFGSLVSTATVIGTYMVLGQQQARVFAIWTGFQFFWLAMRSVFYHFTEEIDSIFHYPISLGNYWKAIPPRSKTRIRRLAFALSKYQIHAHPRGLYSYQEDCQSLQKVENMHKEFVLTTEERPLGTIDLSITAVIGDTLLSSACWILGSELTSLQLYDSCIVILDIRGASVAIPCARVLTDKPPGSDIECGMEIKFPPRGIEPRNPSKVGQNKGTGISWWYWIPCGEGLWLQIHSTDLKILGKQTASILSDDQVTKKLKSGDLFIGLSEVAHVKEVVRNSVYACEILQDFLS